ncbi:hypothetical protein KKG41_06575 [Patescibacteria group bacterium]|nr:hypothetical protein [Patescibacteria group bacterium]MBU1890678.1 hypothetical protein [Patescibacteria group bacterium]
MKSFFLALCRVLCVLLVLTSCSKNHSTTPEETQGSSLPNSDSMIGRFSCQDCVAEGILFSRCLNELEEYGGRSEIHVFSDSVVTRVTDNLNRNEDPIWVPFERAFIDVTLEDHYYLEIVCADGGLATALFPNLSSDFHYICPSVSFDGRDICFIKRVKSGGFDGCVVVYNVDSMSFTGYDLGEYGTPISAEISPNGQYIVCTNSSSRICLIDKATRKVHLLTDVDSSSPSFSPDSRQIVYSQENSKNEYAVNLWLQDILTGHRRQLTTETTVKDYDACFSPLGKEIVFSRRMLPYHGSEIYHLWILNLYDESLTQITDGPENDYDPRWR